MGPRDEDIEPSWTVCVYVHSAPWITMKNEYSCLTASQRTERCRRSSQAKTSSQDPMVPLLMRADAAQRLIYGFVVATT